MSWLGELLEQNSSDPRARLELGQQLLSQLQISKLPSDSTLLNDFCDLVVQWLSGSNFKVREGEHSNRLVMFLWRQKWLCLSDDAKQAPSLDNANGIFFGQEYM